MNKPQVNMRINAMPISVNVSIMIKPKHNKDIQGQSSSIMPIVSVVRKGSKVEIRRGAEGRGVVRNRTGVKSFADFPLTTRAQRLNINGLNINGLNINGLNINGQKLKSQNINSGLNLTGCEFKVSDETYQEKKSENEILRSSVWQKIF